MTQLAMAWPRKTRELMNHHIDSTVWNDFAFRADDIVAMIVGMFTATSLAGGHEQLERMFGLLMNAVRRPATGCHG